MGVSGMTLWGHKYDYRLNCTFVGSKHPQPSHSSDPLPFIQYLLCSLGPGSILEKTASKHLVAPGLPFSSKSFVFAQIDEQFQWYGDTNKKSNLDTLDVC